MIAHFPTPHPEEILYSVCARYSERVNYPGAETINQELFGSRGLAAIIDLPCNLSYLDTHLPAGHSLTPKTLISKRTLLGFYSPFLPEERVRRILHEMEGSDGSSVHKLTGVTASTVRRPDWLRFCPICIEGDRRKFKECYWHRVHQVPGVLVCPTHEVLLENSTAPARNRVNSAVYVPAEQAVTTVAPRPLDPSSTYHLILINLARDVAWLLDQYEFIPGFDSLRTGYSRLLIEHGLATTSGRIRTDALVSKLRNTYPPYLLEMLQCPFDEQKANNWPSRIVNHLNQGKVHHPLRHLLLIQALDQTAASFFEICKKKIPATFPSSKPFGSGPWPCLNPTCEHFRQPVITAITISYDWRKSQTSFGIFQCCCGFTYSRSGPDSSRDDCLRFDRIKLYGLVWDKALRRLWKDPSVSISEASRTLGVSHNTVKYQATRMGLKFPRRGPGRMITELETNRRETIKRQLHKSSVIAKSKHNYRRSWLEVVRKNPEANRTKLREEIAPREYRWLTKYDPKWFDAHKPPPFRRTGSARKVDWPRRDVELSEDVRSSALRLRNAIGFPIWVTKQAIGRDLDRKDWFSKKQIKKLPLTAKVLKEVLESTLEFSIRKVRWAAARFREEGQSPSLSTLANRAHLAWEMWYMPKVKAVIKTELSSLQGLGNPISVAAA
jgi:hypothetical protein